MAALPPTTRRVLLLSVMVLAATLLTLPAILPVSVKALLPALVALGAGMWLWRDAEAGGRRLREAEAELEAVAKAGSQLRHDLRGILSPALLTADRLSTSQDPVARRAAETMIATIERAEVRLRPGLRPGPAQGEP